MACSLAGYDNAISGSAPARGWLMADHTSFTVANNVQVYSAKYAVLGSAAATRTPTACCDRNTRQ
jgi:hypothetical protein